MPRTTRRFMLAGLGAVAFNTLVSSGARAQSARLQSWPLNTPSRTSIHDVAPAPDGSVWLTERGTEHLSVIRTS